MARARRSSDFDEEQNDSELDVSELVDQRAWSSDSDLPVANTPQSLARQSVGLQQRSVHLQEQANLIHAAHLQVAISSNELLGDIDETLDRMGHGIDQLHDDLLRHEEIGREQLAKQDEHLRQQATHIDLTRQQLELQKQQIDKVERDRLVKDLLYNLERYNQRLARISDAVSRAYGARRLIERMSLSKFTAKDLFEIADKRLFDEQISAINGFITSLDAEGQRVLRQFEKAYSDFLKATQADPAADAPEVGESMSFSEESLLRARPLPPAYNKTPLDADTAKVIGKLVKNIVQSRYKARTLMLVGGGAAGVFALLTVLLAMAALSGGGIAIPLALSSGLLTFVASLLAGFAPLRGWVVRLTSSDAGTDADADEQKLNDRYSLSFDEASELLAAWQQYLRAAEAFDRELPARLKNERTRVEQHNRTVTQMASQRATFIAQRKAKRDGAMQGLRQYLTIFLEIHPAMQDWAPKPA
jgi:hypothetical protein